MRRFSFLSITARCVLTSSSDLVAQSPRFTSFRGLTDHFSVDRAAYFGDIVVRASAAAQISLVVN
jgi:hypothetical protein